MPDTPRIRMVRHEPEELSDAQIAKLISFGRREAGLIEEIEQAARSGDREKLWRLAEELVRLQDQAGQV
jgi:hypothetical protein